MHGVLTGFFEARVTSSSPSGRMHYRLFCVLDYDAQGASKPILCVVDGESKRVATTLSGARYADVAKLGTEYRKENPRSFASEADVESALIAR